MSEPSMQGLSERLGALLAERCGDSAEVLELRPLAGGACQDNVRVDIAFGPRAHDGSESLAGKRRFVLRSDAIRSLAGSIPRRVEARVVAAAVRAGVRTPPARFASEGLLRPGASACLLDWREGVAIGRKVVAAPELAQARAGLLDELAAELAAIHTVRRDHNPGLFEGVGTLHERAVGHHASASEPEAYGQERGHGDARFDFDPVQDALAALELQVGACVEPHPALHWLLRWLTDHAPGTGDVTLVHGDFRVGNFLVTPEGLSAVLDWEFAHFGAPEEDLAWISVRDWRFGVLDKPVGGLGDRAAFWQAYSRHAGRLVDPVAVHWWEVMGNARWAAGAVHQAERVLSGAEVDLEFVAIGRRAAEMEWEALRLVGRGPQG